jgi:hypothetical protein
MKPSRFATLAVTAGIAAAALSTAGCTATSSESPPAAPPSAAASTPPVETNARAAFRPCDWVTTDEAAAILGGPVSTKPQGDQSGSVKVSCGYSRGPGEDGMTSELRLPGAFPGDAESEFALAAAADNSTAFDGVGIKAQCVFEPTTTPPSNTLVVLLSGDRIYRATGWYSISCDDLKQFAQAAIGRIGA